MPKLYEYFGLVVFFYANEHEPIHVHGEYQGGHARAKAEDIVHRWVDFFVLKKHNKPEIITRKLK